MAKTKLVQTAAFDRALLPTKKKKVHMTRYFEYTVMAVLTHFHWISKFLTLSNFLFLNAIIIQLMRFPYRELSLI